MSPDHALIEMALDVIGYSKDLSPETYTLARRRWDEACKSGRPACGADVTPTHYVRGDLTTSEWDKILRFMEAEEVRQANLCAFTEEAHLASGAEPRAARAAGEQAVAAIIAKRTEEWVAAAKRVEVTEILFNEDFIYLDSETTGLDPRTHQMFEVAWADDYVDSKITSIFLSHTLRDASDAALRVNRYFERRPFFQSPRPGVSKEEADAEAEVAIMTALSGKTVVGQNPGFDLGFLFARYGYTTNHYRTIDLGSYAMAVLNLPSPPSLEGTWEHLTKMGLVHGDGPNHTAIGDVRALREAFHALRRLARKGQAS